MKVSPAPPTLVRLALALAVAVAPGFAQDPPEIEVTNRSRTSGGASSPILGMGEGVPGFFKPDGPVVSRGSRLSAYGNMEAELFMSRLLTELGFLTPEGRLVQVKPRYWDLTFRPRTHLQAEQINPEFTGGQPVWTMESLPPDMARAMDTGMLRRLALIDAIVGNGDRHAGNILFTRTKGGRVVPLPIDHNFALAGEGVVPDSYWQRNFLESYQGVELPTDRVHDGRKVRGAERAGTLGLILNRNVLYQELLNAAVHDPAQREAFVREAEKLRSELTDAMIERHVASLTDAEIGAKDPAARRREMVEVMKARRDQLPGALREYFGKLDAYWKGEGVKIRKLEEVIPRELIRRAGLSEGALVRLTNRLVAPEMVFPADIYRELRLEGLEPLLAREVTAAIMRGRGMKFPVSVTARFEPELRRSGALERAEQARPRPGENGALAGRAPADTPFEIRMDGNGGLQLRDMRGELLPLEYREAIAPVAERLLREVRPGPGERVLIRREAFAGGGGRAVYRAQLLDARGSLRAGYEIVREPGAAIRVQAQEVRTSRSVPGVAGEYASDLQRVELAELRALRARMEQRAVEFLGEGKLEEARALNEAAAQLRTLEARERPPRRSEVFSRPGVKEAATVLRAEGRAVGTSSSGSRRRWKPPQRIHRPRGRL